MMRSLSIAATGMQAQETMLDQKATDIANMNTTGYKQGRTEFQDLMYQTVKEPGGEAGVNQTPVGVQVGSGTKVSAQYAIHEMGPPKITGGLFDMMINGEGFFAVQLPNGQVAYTRDGSFKIDTQGRLMTSNGYPVVPQIQIPPNSARVTINNQGNVVTVDAAGKENQIGQVELVNFINPAALKRMGENLLGPTVAAGEPLQGKPGEGLLGTIQQGMLEGSNVKPTEAIMDLIKAQRTYETNAKVMNVSDQMWSITNNVGMK